MDHPIASFWFGIENFSIAGAYLFMAVFVAPLFMHRQGVQYRTTRIGGIGFFLLCGMTHVDMALRSVFGSPMDQEMAARPYMHAIHGPQAVMVWMFVFGLYVELVDVEWRHRWNLHPTPDTPVPADEAPAPDPDGPPRP